jgi:hypothetical protein
MARSLLEHRLWTSMDTGDGDSKRDDGELSV